MMDINLKGTFLCSQAVLPAMKAQRFGRIVNLGSVVGKNGGNARPWLDAGEQANAGNVAYGVSKAGVHAMTAFLAKEVGGVRRHRQRRRSGPDRDDDDHALSARAHGTRPGGPDGDDGRGRRRNPVPPRAR